MSVVLNVRSPQERKHVKLGQSGRTSIQITISVPYTISMVALLFEALCIMLVINDFFFPLTTECRQPV